MTRKRLQTQQTLNLSEISVFKEMVRKNSFHNSSNNNVKKNSHKIFVTVLLSY